MAQFIPIMPESFSLRAAGASKAWIESGHGRSGGLSGSLNGIRNPGYHQHISGIQGGFANNNYWSSSENNNNTNNAWKQNFNNGNQNNNNRNNNNRVRPVRGFFPSLCIREQFRVHFSYMMTIQPELFEPPRVTVEQIFEAYYSCRKHKRNTREAIDFETDLESNLLCLLSEINDGSYEIGQSTVFVIDNPVKREVFAASFRDRIVHHLLINMINPTIEKRLIYDCYACRVGKGTHFGIERLSHFMRSATSNYTKEAWILKLDVKGFFMSIDKRVLWKRLRRFLIENYHENNLGIILHLCEMIIFNDPTAGCEFRSPSSKWEGLADSKSLFRSRKNCGLPIGNLTSQVFANFYMSYLDHFVKHDLGIRGYGRYVDDFFLIHESKDYLLECRDRIELFLRRELHLRLSPTKQYLQTVSHGCMFLGVMIRPGRILVSRRTVNNFRQRIKSVNIMAENHKPSMDEMKAIRDSINSYLGIMEHYDSFILRQTILSNLDARINKRIDVSKDVKKISLRR